MRLRRIAALMAASAIAGAAAVYAAPRTPRGATWQQSEAPAIELGVRDKFGDLQSYTAVFTVTGPDGKKLTAQKKVKGDSWGDAVFPQDFGMGNYMAPGSYKWQCAVSGKKVIGGSFNLKNGGDETRLTITTK